MPTLTANPIRTNAVRADALESEEKVVVQFRPMVRRLAGAMVGTGVELDDLLQVGNLALIRAFRSFDKSRGDFAPYAYASIRGELKKYLRDYNWSIRPPRRVQELHARVRDARDVVVQSPRHHADIRTVAESVGATVTEVGEALNAMGCMFPASLDQSATPDGPQLSESVSCAEPGFDEVETAIALRQICTELDDDDRELIRLRFYENLSQREIAKQLGTSQVRVCRRLAALLVSLRERAEAA